jgi:hypothetical protein
MAPPSLSVLEDFDLLVMEPTTGIEPVNLILTKDALYQLSYVGLERETGFEPATHSLEGCCSSQLSYSRPEF